MHLTAGILRATYDRLRMFKPFNRWDLPPGSNIKFTMVESVDFIARASDKPLTIEFSKPRSWTLATLDRTMAHEMIHIRQLVKGTLGKSEDSHHNREFHRMSQPICKELEFADIKPRKEKPFQFGSTSRKR